MTPAERQELLQYSQRIAELLQAADEIAVQTGRRASTKTQQRLEVGHTFERRCCMNRGYGWAMD